MSTDHRHAASHTASILGERSLDDAQRRLAPRPSEGEGATPAPPAPTGGASVSPEAVAGRWRGLPLPASAQAALLDPWTLEHGHEYEGNIEYLIGTAKVPVGLAGPLRVNGLFALGDYYVPLATTEAALVASYARGAQVITAAGGCAALLLNEGISRAPGFAFQDIRESGRFVAWATGELPKFKEVAAGTTRHGQLTDLRVTVEGNHVYLTFEFRTGDAAGQNMVTLATDAICAHIIEHSPVKPRFHFVEANLSGDKKASMQSFLLVRGRKVTAEVVVPAEVLRRRLHTTARKMTDYWLMSALGGVLSGTIGVQGHYANGLAAMYIACGQDAACVAESAVGVTRFEVAEGDALYASVTLPNLVVGTVGGGTALPTQKACLSILGLEGTGHARALAEVTAALALAGELSIIGALSCGHFARAHDRLARQRKARKQADAAQGGGPS